MSPKMEIRIWEGSSLIGKTVQQIIDEFKVEVLKLARGKEATNPNGKLKIEAADYLTFIGDENTCATILDKSMSSSSD